MSFGNGSKIIELQRQIEHLQTTNGALCGEINRQERVIERQAERIRELEVVPRKVYAVDTWTDLDDYGVSYIERKLYRTREAAEKRASIIERGHENDGYRSYARIAEFEVVDA